MFWDPVAARRKIGYMPESCPLYPEMRVREVYGEHSEKPIVMDADFPEG